MEIATELKVVDCVPEELSEDGRVRPSKGFAEHVADLNALPCYSNVMTFHVNCWAH